MFNIYVWLKTVFKLFCSPWGEMALEKKKADTIFKMMPFYITTIEVCTKL